MTITQSSVVFALALFTPVNSQSVGNGCVVGVDCAPPMGWRSWNTYGGDVTQALMEAVMDAMAATSYNGESFFSLGYSDVGLDDNYQECGSGVNGSFHSMNNQNTAYVNNINNATFPDMLSMTTYGHNLGFTIGFYENNCICEESSDEFMTENAMQMHYEGDVEDMLTYGYDSVKLDGCGPFLDLELYQKLLNETGSYYLIENCHWGNTVPTLDWCPFSYFRTSGDIKATWDSMWSNLQSMIPYQDLSAPLSRQGCWAYPDMLEVGNMPSYIEDRSHFGAWCITSSPLILGHDITNTSLNNQIISIVGNQEAIAVNQAWFGHPGYLVSAYNPQGSISEDSSYVIQTWAKPISDNQVAVFVTSGLLLSSSSYQVEIKFEDIGFSADTYMSVRDIWAETDVEGASLGSFTTPQLAPHDSYFYLFTVSSA